MDVCAARAAFGPGVEGYLDTASMGLPTAGTAAALQAAVRDWYAGTVRYQDWESALEWSRTRWAELFGVDPARVGTIGSITTAVAAVTHRLAARPGVLVAHRAEFRSLLLPAIERFGADRVRWVTGPYTAETFQAALTEDCAVVAVSSVSSADGARIDLTRLAAMADAVGSRLVVDASQSEGIVSLGVDPARCAAVVTVGYKGLLAPRGSGFVWCAEDLPGLPIAPSPYGMADAELRGSYGASSGSLAGGAGLSQSPSWLSWVGMASALAFLGEYSAAEREEWTLRLSGRLREGVRRAGLQPQTSDLPSSVVSVPVRHPAEVTAALERAGVRCAVRNGRLRLAAHFFNNDSDIDRALAAIEAVNRDLFERI